MNYPPKPLGELYQDLIAQGIIDPAEHSAPTMAIAAAFEDLSGRESLSDDEAKAAFECCIILARHNFRQKASAAQGFLFELILGRPSFEWRAPPTVEESPPQESTEEPLRDPVDQE